MHDPARLSDRLQPGGKVRLGADDRIVHPILAAEVADVAVAGVDAHAGPERLLNPALPPLGIELAEAALHINRHAQAGVRVLFDALGLGIPEERQHRVADELVDGRAMLEGDPPTFQ